MNSNLEGKCNKVDRNQMKITMLMLLARTVLTVLFAYGLFWLSLYVIFDYQELETNWIKKDIIRIEDYVVDDDGRFTVNGDDPYFIVNAYYRHLRTVKIYFSKPLEEDTNVQFYYRMKSRDFREEKSISVTAEAGDTEVRVNFGNVPSDELRMDISNDFSFDRIYIEGDIGIINNASVIVAAIVSVILIFLFWFLLSTHVVRFLWKCYCLAIDIYNNYEAAQTPLRRFLDGCKNKKIGIEKVFVILAIVLGTLFSTIIPPDQVPDELTHYRQMLDDGGFPDLAIQIEEFFGRTKVAEIEGIRDEKLDVPLLKKHIDDKFDYSRVSFTGIKIGLLKHFPQYITFMIGYVLHLSIYKCMIMAEIGAVFFFAIIGFIALKYMPFKKELLCAIMLFPMTVQQCSSVSYDAVMLPVCFLLTAYMFNCIHEKEVLGWRDVGVFATTALIIAMTKPTYFPLYLMILLIPYSKWKLPIWKNINLADVIKKYKWLVCLVCFLVVAAGIYILREHPYIMLLRACMHTPKHTLKLIYVTMREYDEFLRRSMVGWLGWLDIFMSPLFYHIVFVFLVLCSLENDKGLRRKHIVISVWERLLAIIISLSTISLIIVVMFLWTFKVTGQEYGTTVQEMVEQINGIAISYGVQGRYYLPVTLFFFLPYDNILKIKEKALFIAQVLYYPTIFIWCVIEVWGRYGY